MSQKFAVCFTKFYSVPFLQTSNCSALSVQLEIYYLSVMYGVEFILGFLGNLIVILGYVLWMRKWRSINVYLFNLAVSDLVFLCTLPYLSYTYAWKQGNILPNICLINRFILHINLYSSILFMAWVSLDRYLLLQNPLRQHILLKFQTAVWVSAISWLLITIQVTPLMIFILADLKLNNWTQCSDFGSLSGHETTGHLAYSLFLTLTGFIIPLLAICFFTLGITRLLKTQEGLFSQRSVSFHRPRCVALAAALMFLVLYSPYHLMRNVYISSQLTGLDSSTHSCIKSLYILSRPVAFAHSVINPVFYFLMGDQFKELLLNGIRSLCPSHCRLQCFEA